MGKQKEKKGRLVEIEKVPGNRKHDLVAAEGCLFERNKSIVGGVSYRCIKVEKGGSGKQYKRCPAILHLTAVGSCLVQEHSHGPSYEKIEARKIIAVGKNMVKESRIVTTKQVMTTVETMTAQAGISGSYLGRTSNLKHRINEHKRKFHGHANLGACRADVVVPQELQLSLRNQQFLLYDNHDGANRILVFASPDALDKLSYCDTWLCDGTFKACPKMFDQVYTIFGVYNKNCPHPNGANNENCLVNELIQGGNDGNDDTERRAAMAMPFVYAYLPGRTIEVYKELFQAVQRRTTGEPRYIITDFEMGAITALGQVFETAERRGCLFHLTKTIFGRVQKSPDVLERYMKNDADGRKVRRVIRSLGALAFLPEGMVIPAYHVLRGEFPREDGVRQILESFSETYLGINWQDVRFPVNFWNVLDRFQDGQPRTNNGAEGWHYRLNSIIPGAHPCMNTSIQLLREEENHFKLEADKIRSGITPHYRLKTLQLERRLKNIVASYDQNELYHNYLDFLNEIQQCLHEFIEL